MLGQTGKIQRVRSLLLLLVLAVVFALPAAAQQPGRVLENGVPVPGTIDADNPAQVYVFEANVGDLASLTVTAGGDLTVTLLLTDAGGNPLGQASVPDEVGQVALRDVALPATGVYYVTVFPTLDGENSGEGTFIVTLNIEAGTDIPPAETPEPVATEAVATPEPTAAPVAEIIPPEAFTINQVLASGITINLTWNTPDDLNLQVRDPVGETLFWDSRTTSSNGTFGFDVNGLCEVVTPTNNVETASWPSGPISTGSYEILVYYRQSCEGANPVDFTVDVTVNGETLAPVTGTLAPPPEGGFNVYIASFDISPEGAVSLSEAGPYTDTQVLTTPAAEILAGPAQPIALDQPVTGVIVDDQDYQAYQFTGQSGDVLSVTMEQTAGSLDTLLLLLDSAGNVVASNDDIETAVNTNSQMNAFLPTDGVYTIVATRYGKDVGGTEGTFTLTLSGQLAEDLPQEVIDLGLPDGDIEVILTWNNNADLRLLVRDPFLDSVFNDEPAVNSGGRLVADFSNLNCTVAPASPVSYIYWPPGFLRIGSYEIDVWNRNTCNDPTPTTFTLYVVVNGTLVLNQSATIGFDQHYLTSFQIEDTVGTTEAGPFGLLGGSETLPYQAELTTALVIQPGQAVPGVLDGNNVFDVYAFQAQPGDIVSVEMLNTGNVDPSLFLLNPNGIEVAANDDSAGGISSLISDFLVTEAGTYYIIATRYGTLYGGTEGRYSLTLRVVPAQ